MDPNKFSIFKQLGQSVKIQLIFLVSLALSTTVIYFVEQTYLQQKRLSVENISGSYANLISNNVYHAISAVYPLAALVRKQNGEVNGFSELATELLPFYPGAASLQLAPDGIVKHIVPLEGNENAIGHNLLIDLKRSKDAYLAKVTGQLTLAGPFDLVQGGIAAAARLPIYLEQLEGKQAFWGFSTVLIRFPEVLKTARLDKLVDSGYAYELSQTSSNGNGIKVIASSKEPLENKPIIFSIQVPNGKWYFKVTPKSGWSNPFSLLLEIILGLGFTLLTTLSACLIKYLRDNKNTLEQLVLSRTQELKDNLTRLDLALAAAHQGWFDFNIQTGQVRVHDAYPGLLGYKTSEFYRKFKDLQQWLEYIHPDDQGSVLSAYQDCVDKGGKKNVEYRINTKEGSWKWIRSTGEIIEWDNNNPVRMVGIHTDITEPKRGEQVLRALAETSSSSNEAVFKTIVRELALSHNISYALIVCINPNKPMLVDTLAVWANDRYIDNISYSLKGTPCLQVIEKGICYYPENIQSLFPDDPLLVEMDIHSFLGVPLKSSQNQVLGLLVLSDNKSMTAQLQTLDLLDSLAVRASLELERRVLDEKLKLSSRVFNGAHESIVITDFKGIIIDVNPSFTSVTGYNREEVIGKHTSLFNPIEKDVEAYAGMKQALNEKGYWQSELWNRKKDGQLYAELLTISSLKDDHGKTTHYVGLSTDITQSKEQQQKLEQMAHYDVLTQLPNRVLFADRFAQAIAHSTRNQTLLAVCFVDLDNFKTVNDNYGHDVGDQLLINVTARIKAIIREEDTLSRQGGDEFTLLMADIKSYADCEKNLERILTSISEPYLLEQQSLKISASIGVTLYPLDNADQDTLIRHADQAMYHAKLAGRNRYHLFNAKEDQQIIQKLTQLQVIRQALLNDEFCLYYQPKVNMKTGEVFGVEALIRWQHPEKGLIPPLDFLFLIEGTELEIRVGHWVINEALKQLDLLKTQGLEFEMSINISSKHLQSPLFFTQLEQALEKFPLLDSRYIQLEILESSALGDLHAIGKIIKTCRESLGIHIALDDFGTGYSSLTHLRNLPANTIKIDQTFVRDVLDDPNDFAIIDGVIGLADAFNREVIAEGVETIEHGLILLIMGCERAQGYGIARPMLGSKVLAWVNNYVPYQQWISFNKHIGTVKERKIKFIRLITEHWFKNVNDRILENQGNDENWLITNYVKCHFGIWIQRAKQERLFDQKWLTNLEKAYQDMYHLALNLKVKYQSGEASDKSSDLITLNTAFETVIAVLDQYDFEPSHLE